MIVVLLSLLAWAFAQTNLELGKTITINVPARTSPNSLLILLNTGTPGSELKLTVERANQVGQEMVLVRHGSPPTKFDYDEIDTAVTPVHVIQFTSSVNETYFGIANLATTASVYNVTLNLLAADTAVFSWDGPAIQVCDEISNPMYGPPSISLGLKSFAVACARRAQKSSAEVEFRKYNGQKLRSWSLNAPRGGLFQEPAILYAKGIYVTANTYMLPGQSYQYDFINLRTYEEDGTLLTNKTDWGSRYIPVSREEFPNLLWDGTQVAVYWHSQFSWQAVYRAGYDLLGNPTMKSDSLRESTNLGNNYGVPSRVRAVINPVITNGEDIEVAVFRWDGNPSGKKLQFYIQRDYKAPAPVFVIEGDSLINNTHGGLDLQTLSDGNYVTVHPLASYGTLQVTLIDRERAAAVKYITIKHKCYQPNLVVIDSWVFLITTNDGFGYVTVLSNQLEIIASQPFGGAQEKVQMHNPVFKYDPLLGSAIILYTGEDQVAYVRRVTITFPEAK